MIRFAQLAPFSIPEPAQSASNVRPRGLIDGVLPIVSFCKRRKKVGR